MFKSFQFVVGGALISAGTSMIVTKHVIQHTLDTTPKAETVVVKELPETKVEAKPEPKASLGRVAFDNERPLVRAGWTTGKTQAIDGGTCTPAIGPDGQEVVVVEFDGTGASDGEAAITAMMAKDGWIKSTIDYMSMFKGGRTASIAMMPDRNKTTYVIGTGSNFRAARYAEESFRKN